MTRRLALPRSVAGRVLLLVLVVALLGLGSSAVLLLGRPGGVAALGSAAPSTSAPPPATTPVPQLTALPATAPVPAPAALGAVLDPLASVPTLGTLSGRVSDALTGQVLWERSAGLAQTPASTAKTLTVAAALLALPRDATVPTRVVAGATPGQVVLVGSGDPTLTAEPAGTEGYYSAAPRLDDLAAAVRAAAPGTTSVVVDTAAWTGPTLADGWFAADVGGGFIAPAEPVMLDGARADPTEDDSTRSTTPSLDAGRALASRLGVPASAVTAGTAPAGAAVLGEVRSAPLVTRLGDLLRDSDNVLAEAVGRELAVARGLPASFAGATGAVTAVLGEAGFDTASLDLSDTSGLSAADRVDAGLLDDVMTAAAGTGDPRLRPLVSFLPVGGASGTLADRFTSAGGGAGWVRAKTGTLTGVNSLAGTVTDVDGRLLTFALVSNGASSSRPALDAITSALRGCGCR